jgi:hypothetical protein
VGSAFLLREERKIIGYGAAVALLDLDHSARD